MVRVATGSGGRSIFRKVGKVEARPVYMFFFAEIHCLPVIVPSLNSLLFLNCVEKSIQHQATRRKMF